ncbi:hypothetical protein [Anoxynatronum buryatiense]|uniref:Phage abortive infection protein n=1 Tax=Anoxynatronum buryatiense TaxID=489973 RepID=A0AA46AHD7_9CLOT|nr:hypothetical protein [Anoxynatronum buryatiense]SMP38280.1 hypothetical protein SAMN06296020_10177 [Anoxynatronum buryatiense]
MKKISLRYKLILVIFIAIPIVVAGLMEINLPFSFYRNNDWIGFFASYFGAIIGVIGVYEVMRFDQKKRDEERKDEMFLNHLPIYRKIESSLVVSRLTKLRESLFDIEKDPGWDMVDSRTKRKLMQIKQSLYYCDEVNGFHHFMQSYIMKNLYDDIKITVQIQADEYTEAAEIEDVPIEYLDMFIDAVKKCFDLELETEYRLVIKSSRNEMLEIISKVSQRDFTNNIDVIFKKLSRIDRSDEWAYYISKHQHTFSQIDGIRNEINRRIEKALNY